MRKFKTLLTSMLVFLSLTPGVSAAPTGLSVSPISFDINLQPGAFKDEIITLQNKTNSQLELEVSPLELAYRNGVYIRNSDGAYVEMLKLDRAKIILTPGQATSINARVTIPTNATMGSFKLAANIRWVQSDDSSMNTGGVISPEVSVLFNINVLNQSPRTAVQVTKLEVPGVIVTNKVNINYEIKNNAPYFTKPLAYLQLVNPRGKPVWRQVINESGAILDSGRTLSGQATAEFEFNNPLDMGQYKVQLLIVDTQLATQDILTGTTLFIHWFAIIVGVVIFISLLLGVNKLRKKYLVSSKPKFK